jgi:AGZA family xanthine/uracil permease-like MFS transporter
MSQQTFRYKMFVREDIDGFFALFIDNLANLMILTSTTLGLLKMPAELVFGRILPGFALAMLVGNIYYAWQAKWLAEKRKGRM